MEEFRTMIGALRVQAQRAYNEQLEVVRLLREATKLQRETVLPDVKDDDLSNTSVRAGSTMNRNSNTERP